MKKILSRTFLVFAVVLFVVAGFSCKKKDKNPSGGDTTTTTTYTITYNLNGGSLPDSAAKSYTAGKAVVLPTPTKDGADFDGWYETKEFTGSAVAAIRSTDSGNKTYYAKWKEAQGSTSADAKWELNQIGFNGGGMKIVIKVLPVSEYDPFDAGYSGNNKALKQAHLKAVESKYNIDIEYSAWDNEAPWGPERVSFIKNSYVDGTFQQKGVYIITIASQWIPTLVKGGALANLYNMSTQEGIFVTNPVQYEQNDTVNEALAVNKKVYGYAPGSARADFFMYYNATLADSIGMEDPAELWFKGEWTWSTFESWVTKAQKNLGAGQYALDCGYPEFTIGAAAAKGGQMINSRSGAIMFTKSSVTSIFDKIQGFYQGGLWNKSHGVSDVTTVFLNGNSLLTSGGLWFLKESTRFDPSTVTFEIGVVPYPADDTDSITPYTAPYSYEDSEGNTVEVTEPLKNRSGETIKTSKGDDVYGIDLTSASFQVPYTGTSNYSIMNYESGRNGITTSIVFAILHDLVMGIGDDPTQAKQTSDEAYRGYLKTKTDNPLDVEVIMSVQNNQYYELMEVVSMTVGDGSHFGPNAFWPLASGIAVGTDNAATKLKEVEDIYRKAVEQIGY